MVLWRSIRPSRTNTQKKDVLFIIGDWNAKVGSQEIPEVTGEFGPGVQKEAGQRLIEFCQVYDTVVIANTLFQQHKRRLYTWTSSDGQYRHQVDYSLFSRRWRSSIHQETQDFELTVAPIINSLFTNSDLNWREEGKPVDHSGMTWIKSLMIIQWK